MADVFDVALLRHLGELEINYCVVTVRAPHCAHLLSPGSDSSPATEIGDHVKFELVKQRDGREEERDAIRSIERGLVGEYTVYAPQRNAQRRAYT